MYERDKRTDGHRVTANAALDASIARPKDYSTFCTVEANY